MMKSIKYIVSILFLGSIAAADACGVYDVDNPLYLKMFRICNRIDEEKWQYNSATTAEEKHRNCELWQQITSDTISIQDIYSVVYPSKLTHLQDLNCDFFKGNGFAAWLSAPKHSDDLEYLRLAKEVEELRRYMCDPWYYAYDEDDEHAHLQELLDKCLAYDGKRHAARYALQAVRIYATLEDDDAIINLWENKIEALPRDVITDMTTGYVIGAYSEKDKTKALEICKRTQDIEWAMRLEGYNDSKYTSEYTTSEVQELEFIFNHYPDSPLLSYKLQHYVREHERFVFDKYDAYIERGYTPDRTEHMPTMYAELKRFAKKAALTPNCPNRAMWNYSLAFLYYLDKDNTSALTYLKRAEASEGTQMVKESVRAMRFLMDGMNANNSTAYRSKLLRELRWIDQMMARDLPDESWGDWTYNNTINWSFYFWQDVTRKVLLGEVCPRLRRAGNETLALQLANYATNRIYQLSPAYEEKYDIYGRGKDDTPTIIMLDEYRASDQMFNFIDYRSPFFTMINGVSADNAAAYARAINRPADELEHFLNSRTYNDTDYIYDIVGTLYLREMRYDKAAEWLARVSETYQARTNLAKDGYFKLDPFKAQADKKQYISDSRDYKLRFAQEMLNLEKVMASDAEVNRRANAKLRYATGLRNSFGRCWYLTDYSHDMLWNCTDHKWQVYTSNDRETFADDLNAQKAYKLVDRLTAEALASFTDPEQAAKAQLEMMNYSTVMNRYADTRAAEQIRGRCDSYHDYCLNLR